MFLCTIQAAQHKQAVDQTIALLSKNGVAAPIRWTWNVDGGHIYLRKLVKKKLVDCATLSVTPMMPGDCIAALKHAAGNVKYRREI